MPKSDTRPQEYQEDSRQVEHGTAVNNGDYAELASGFADFAHKCSAAIWTTKGSLESLGKPLPPSLSSPERIIIFDVLNIGGVISKTSEPPSEIAMICYAVLAELDPIQFPSHLIEYPEFETGFRASIERWENNVVSTPFALSCLALHDRIHGGMRAKRAVSVYGLLVSQLFNAYLRARRDDLLPAMSAGQVANEYLKLLNAYLDGDDDVCEDASDDNVNDEQLDDDGEDDDEFDPSGSEDDESPIGSADLCLECSKAYRLLELPFGAEADEVKKAQRELAKSLHPDVWGQRRGAGFAEEQLKRINAACDHLTQCQAS